MSSRFLTFLLFLSVCPIFCFDRVENVSDPYLDVVLMVDQSWNMTEKRYMELRNDVIQWMQFYYQMGDTSTSQFAVIYCCDLGNTCGVVQNFKNGNFSTRVSELLAGAPHNDECSANWDGCVSTAMDMFFNESQGHRKNATKVVVFISDCDFRFNSTDDEKRHMEMAGKFAKEIHGKLMFFCAASENKAGDRISWDANNNDSYANLMKILKINNQNKEAIIRHHPGNTVLLDHVTKILPQREMQVTDCKMKRLCNEECSSRINPENCYIYCNFTIDVKPFFGKKCIPLPNTSSIETCPECLPPDYVHHGGDAHEKEEKIPPWKIASGAVGGFMVLAIVLGVLGFIFIKRRNQSRKLAEQGKSSTLKKSQENLPLSQNESSKTSDTTSITKKSQKSAIPKVNQPKN